MSMAAVLLASAKERLTSGACRWAIPWGEPMGIGTLAGLGLSMADDQSGSVRLDLQEASSGQLQQIAGSLL